MFDESGHWIYANSGDGNNYHCTVVNSEEPFCSSNVVFKVKYLRIDTSYQFHVQ